MNESRRRWLVGAGSLVGCALLPLRSAATPEDLRAALKRSFGETPITPGRVALKLPALAENGNSVRLTVAAESPMTPEDHVRFIQLFSPGNPLPDIARFEFGPHSGRAEVETRVRIAGEQAILAVAGMSDGTLWSASASIVVTMAACLDALY